jgi:hypothetical protein
MTDVVQDNAKTELQDLMTVELILTSLQAGLDEKEAGNLVLKYPGLLEEASVATPS